MAEKWGEVLAQQVGNLATGGIVGEGLGMLFQGWKNDNQQKQNAALIKQQLKAQKEMGLFNVERQMDLWNRTNAGAQMEHYKKAGLNPALMYGGGGAGGTTAAATAGAVGQESAAPIPGHNGMNILMPAQVELMRAQARNLDADTAKKSGVETETGYATIENLKANTTNTKVITALNKIEQQIKEASQEDITDALSLNAQIMQQQLFQMQNQTDISNETKATIIKTVQQNYVNAVIQGHLMKSNIQLNSAQINKMAQDILQGWKDLDIKGKEQRISEAFSWETMETNRRNASTAEKQQRTDANFKESLINQAQINNVIQAFDKITDLIPTKGTNPVQGFRR